MDAFRSGYVEGLSGTHGWHCTGSESLIAVAVCSGRNRGQAAGFGVYSDRRFIREFSQHFPGLGDEALAKTKQLMIESYRKDGMSEEWIRSVLSD